VLTGVAMVVMDLLDVRLGFTFSAGLFDYVLNFGQSTRPWLLIPIGLLYGAAYYGLFRLAIRLFNLKTPGREDADEAAVEGPAAAGSRGPAFVAALGGAANLRSVAACTTRLRLGVASRDRVDEAALKRLGARGLISPTPETLQVVLGPAADAVADEIRAALKSPTAVAPEAAPVERLAIDAALLAAVGGRGNLAAAARRAGRLCLTLLRPEQIDEAALGRAAPGGFVRTAADRIQILPDR
jgi:N-acetylglucosamine PTS system EIICBA or EIICB component